MSKLSQIFEKKKVFSAFLTAGDPTLGKTEEYILTMAEAGADIIEIGIPFSDPIAEGAIVQEANVRALSNNEDCSIEKVFTMVEHLKRSISIPFVFRTYLNPVFRYGYEDFCKRCQKVNVVGVIIPDMPYEESQEFDFFAKKYEVDFIVSVAPTSKVRLTKILKGASGYISILSVPSVRKETETRELLNEVKKVTDIPVVIAGDTKNEVENAYKIADGVIASIDIVKIIEKYKENAVDEIKKYIKEIVA